MKRKAAKKAAGWLCTSVLQHVRVRYRMLTLPSVLCLFNFSEKKTKTGAFILAVTANPSSQRPAPTQPPTLASTHHPAPTQPPTPAPSPTPDRSYSLRVYSWGSYSDSNMDISGMFHTSTSPPNVPVPHCTR